MSVFSLQRTSRQELWPAWLLASLALVLAFLAVPRMADGQARLESLAPLIEDLLPTTVRIASIQQVNEPDNLFEDLIPRIPGLPVPEMPLPDERQRSRRGMGSGFIIEADGYVVTNHHVVVGSTSVEVELYDGRVLPAEIIGMDEETDLALLKVDIDEQLPVTTWADSDALRVGDWLIAIGNPYNVGTTATLGIVSALNRSLEGAYDQLIQTDAAINVGNSGGAIFTIDGEVAGINRAIVSNDGGSDGIGFAIPSNQAQMIIAELRESGVVERGYLGVSVAPLSEELRAESSFEEGDGVFVADVVRGGPSQAAGLRAGDIIIAIDETLTPEPQVLLDYIAEQDPEQTVTVKFVRDGEERSTEVTLALRPTVLELAQGLDFNRSAEAFGLTMAPLSADERQNLGLLPADGGLRIVAVDREQQDGDERLNEGDILLTINFTAVRTPEGAIKLLQDLASSGETSVSAELIRDGEVILALIDLS